MRSKFLNKYEQEEQANIVSHGFGLLMCLPAICITFFQSHVLEIMILILGSAFMYFSSTMYHSRVELKSKHFWRIVDHISIFLLIGCSYTAYLLIFLNNEMGMNFLKIQWLLVIAGILFKIIFKERFEYFSLTLYLILGWRVVHIFQDVTEKMNFDTKFFLFMGGIAYTIGVVFYAWENLRFNHAIWHLFVLLGSYSHLLALWLM